MSLDGASFVDSFTRADAPSHHSSQYYEIAGNRAFYRDGWIAATTPANLPWVPGRPTPPDQFQWELYNLQDDYSEFDDLAQKYPGKLAELKSGFEVAAVRNQVLPLDSNMGRRFMNAALRPYTTLGRDDLQYGRTERWLPDQAFPDLTRKSWQLTVPISQLSARPSGTLITQGGWQNGWGLFLFDGKPTFIYRANCLPGHLWRMSSERLAPGRHELVVTFHPDAPAPGAGATVSLAVDARPPVTLHLGSTVAFTFGNEGVGIGRDFGTTLDDSHALPFRYPGELDPVSISIGDRTH